MIAFDNFADFLAMGGHARYVWPAYAVTLALIIYLLLTPVLRLRRFAREERQRQLRGGGPSESSQ